MTIIKQSKISVSEHEPIESVINLFRASLNKGLVGGFVIVVSKMNAVVGTITDSDLRRHREDITRGVLTKASEIMNREFIYTLDDMSPKEMAESVLEQLSRRKIENYLPINFLPILDSKGRLARLVPVARLIPNFEHLSRQIFIFGQGFVGLTLAMSMVSKELNIIAIEKDQSTYSSIVELKPKVKEPQLIEILTKNFNSNYEIYLDGFEDIKRKNFFCKRVYIIAVGTPLNVSDEARSVNLRSLFDAVEQVSKRLEFGDLLIVRSTVPIGTTRAVSERILAITGLKAGSDFYLAYAPERTVEGNAIAEVSKLPQLLSGFSEECARVASDLFAEFVSSIVICESLEACEMAKLASNAYRDVTFAFANELAQISENHGIDINKLINDANIGYARNAIPSPSPGVGGPCLTKDSYMLGITDGSKSVILSGRTLNESMIAFSTEKIERAHKLSSGIILVLGIAFKGVPPTNDVRNSTSLEICLNLIKRGYNLEAWDAEVDVNELNISGLNAYQCQDLEVSTICILNNHEKNKEMLNEILIRRESVQIPGPLIVFDPWDLTTEAESTRYDFTRLNLSTPIKIS